MIDRLLPDRETETRQVAADHVVEHTMAGMAFNIVEQQRGATPAANEICDGRGFEVGIHLCADALELAERLGFLEPGIEVAAVGAARRRFGIRGFEPLIAAGSADCDAHIHNTSPTCCPPNLVLKQSVVHPPLHATKSP